MGGFRVGTGVFVKGGGESGKHTYPVWRIAYKYSLHGLPSVTSHSIKTENFSKMENMKLRKQTNNKQDGDNNE